MTTQNATLVLALAVVTSVALSLGISSAQEGAEPGEGRTLGIEWAYRPESLSGLVEETPAIVIAKVEAVRDGESFALAASGDSTSETLPTELIDVRVTSVVDGSAPETFTIYQLGANALHAVDDPPYVPGERYMLFVQRRLNDAGTAPHSDGTWIPVAPDGRLEKLASGKLDAEIPGPVAAELDNATVSQATASIEAAGAEAGGE